MFLIHVARADGSMIQYGRGTIQTALSVTRYSIRHGALCVMIIDDSDSPAGLVYVWTQTEPDPTEDFANGMEDARMHLAEGWPSADADKAHWDSLHPMYRYGYEYGRNLQPLRNYDR